MIPSPLRLFTRRSGLALLLALALGTLLRLHGIGYLLPEQTESDAVVYSAQVRAFQAGVFDEEARVQYAFYPHLVPRLAAVIAPSAAHATPARSLEEHTRRAAEPRRRIRLTVALLSLIAIPAVWLLARRFLEPPFAFAAAMLMAASFFTIWFAQQARPHAVASAFTALAVFSAVHLRVAGGWGAFACAGIAAGLALATLQSGIAVLLAIALAVCLRWRANRAEWRRLLGGSLLLIAIVTLFVVLFYPFLFMTGVTGEIGKHNSMIRLQGHLIDLTLFNGAGFRTIARSAWEYDPLISVLGVLGVCIGIGEMWSRRRSIARASRDEVWVVLAYVVPYAIVIGMYDRTYQRFVLPLVPFACVIAAYALCRSVCFAARFGDWPRRAASVAVVGVLAFQAASAWRLADVRSEPSTISQAARWIEGHVPGDARISVVPMMELPLQYTPSAFQASSLVQNDARFMWFRHLRDIGSAAFEGRLWNIHAMNLALTEAREQLHADSDAYVRSLAADYVVIPVAASSYRWVPVRVREAAARLGERVVRISPDAVDVGEDLDFAHQDDDYARTTSWFARAWKVRCVGPVVEIYKLR